MSFLSKILPSMKLSGTYSPSTTHHNQSSSSAQDRHDVTTSESNRYDQHYHTSNSGNTTKSTNIKDESDRSTVSETNTSEKTYNITTNIIGSNVQMPSGGSSATTFTERGHFDPQMYPAYNYPVGAAPPGPNPYGYGPPQVQQQPQNFGFYHPPGVGPIPQHGVGPMPQHGMGPMPQHGMGPMPQHGMGPMPQHIPKETIKTEILFSKMSRKMEEAASDAITLAFSKETDATARAKYICDSFERNFGESWNCVVGSDFGTFARYQTDFYIHLKVANQRVIIFKTPKITAESEIKQLEDKLQLATISLDALETCRELIEEYRIKLDKICSVPRSVTHLNKRHEELQNKIIKQFDAKHKKNELIQKHCHEFITEKTNEIYSTYDEKNKEKMRVENEPGGVRCHGKDNVDLVLKLKDANVIQTQAAFFAMLRTDRGFFMTNPNYEDRPVGIPGNTSISAPHMHARTLELISDKLVEGAKVLDVGFGSGYLTTCMAHMIGSSGFVVGIDICAELKEFATRNISVQHKELLDKGRIILIVGNGKNGLTTYAPYDAIHLGAATKELPPMLLQQLKPGGRIIAPLGPENGQKFTQVDKDLRGEVTYTKTFGVSYALLK